MEKFLEEVNKFYNVDIRENSRERKVVDARHVYNYCLNKLGIYTLIKIADSTNLKCHASVLHSAKKVESDRLFYKKEKKEADYLFEVCKDVLNEDILSFQGRSVERFIVRSVKKKRDIFNFLTENGFECKDSPEAKEVTKYSVSMKQLIDLIYKNRGYKILAE